jgi:hypothetical protein
MRANALNTVSRQFRLVLRNEIRKGLACSGIHEDQLVVLADEGPTRHASIFATREEAGVHLYVRLHRVIAR